MALAEVLSALDISPEIIEAVSQREMQEIRRRETLYRAGRYEDIAIYCLEDVRATCELYLKLEKTLLGFEPAQVMAMTARTSRR